MIFRIMKRVGISAAFLTVGFILAITYSILVPDKEETIDITSSAQNVCRVAIRKVANDPDSIEFPHGQEGLVAQRKDGVYVVRLGFRGRNGFNALILTQATCYLRFDGENWRILRVK